MSGFWGKPSEGGGGVTRFMPPDLVLPRFDEYDTNYPTGIFCKTDIERDNPHDDG